jgi:hypothetical protein
MAGGAARPAAAAPVVAFLTRPISLRRKPPRPLDSARPPDYTDAAPRRAEISVSSAAAGGTIAKQKAISGGNVRAGAALFGRTETES